MARKKTRTKYFSNINWIDLKKINYRYLALAGIVILMGLSFVLSNDSIIAKEITGGATSNPLGNNYWIVQRCTDGTLRCITVGDGDSLIVPEGYTITRALSGKRTIISNKEVSEEIFKPVQLDYILINNYFINEKAIILEEIGRHALVGIVNPQWQN